MQTLSTSRWTGAALLAGVVLGIVNAVSVSPGIDINLSGDFRATAEAMLQSPDRLQARGWMLMAIFACQAASLSGFYLLTRNRSPLPAIWALLAGLVAAKFSLSASVNAFAAGKLASGVLAPDSASAHAVMETVANHSSFHLALVLSSLASAVFYGVFLRFRLLPPLLAGFGLFASLFVSATIVGRDFVAVLGHDAFTAAIMGANLIAIVATGLYLIVKGVREGVPSAATTGTEAR
ncbi:DUF4386 family protein [Qipengyuania flava]|uniref:DUF4386 family protein n=1 Tax=Qipengyuania flava TaxID=192812 RepID=UPI001C63168E|nr:DUF4386 family protein [Qipengyuania flava]QYJ06292.1 DUF4386 domain-containing protein [Qipengyuania flava]